MRNGLDLCQVKPVLPVLHQLIHQTDEEVVADACLALSYLSEVSIDKIQDIIDAGVCPKLVELLQYVYLLCVFHLLEQSWVTSWCSCTTFSSWLIKFHFSRCQSDKVVLPALRTLGNIVTGDDAQTQVERTMYNYLLILVRESMFVMTFILCGQVMTVYLGA